MKGVCPREGVSVQRKGSLSRELFCPEGFFVQRGLSRGSLTGEGVSMQGDGSLSRDEISVQGRGLCPG